LSFVSTSIGYRTFQTKELSFIGSGRFLFPHEYTGVGREVQNINLCFKGTPELHEGGNYKYKILFKFGYVHFNCIKIIEPVTKSTLKDAFFVLQSYIVNK
jgi:hypothetical protein